MIVYTVMSDGPHGRGPFTTTYEWSATEEGWCPREYLFLAVQEHSKRYLYECMNALRDTLLTGR